MAKDIDEKAAKGMFPNSPSLRGEHPKAPSIEEMSKDARVAFPNTKFGPSAAERQEQSERTARARARKDGTDPASIFPDSPTLHGPTEAEDRKAEQAFLAKYKLKASAQPKAPEEAS